jgi:phosphate-selective porin OprO and OprP
MAPAILLTAILSSIVAEGAPTVDASAILSPAPATAAVEGAAAIAPAPASPDADAAKAAVKTSDDTLPAAAPAVAPPKSPRFEGFKIGSKESGNVLSIKGEFQAMGRFFVDDPTHKGASTFLLRRVRPLLAGTVFGAFNFRLTPEFGQGKAGVEDAYVELNAFEWLTLRAGKARVPFGMERLEPSTTTMFTELSLASLLLPNRDVGFAALGSFLDDSLLYHVGLYNGSPDGTSFDLDSDYNRDLFGRVLWRPFRPAGIELLRDVTLGVGYSRGVHRGNSKDPQLATYKTVGGQRLFAFNADDKLAAIAYADGDVERLGPQVSAYVGPVGFMAEYVTMHEQVHSFAGERALHNEAWNVSASVVVTGQKAAYDGVRVAVPANLMKGELGAIELTARYDTLLLDRAVLDVDLAAAGGVHRGARSFWGGLNWYLNDAIKLTANYIVTEYLDNGAFEKPNGHERAILAQTQLVF